MNLLNGRQRAVVLDAAMLAYDKLRWYVGDSSVLRNELLVLAHDSFCAGMQENGFLPTPAADPKGDRRLQGNQLKGPAPNDINDNHDGSNS